jgi:RNA polymerase sigma factor (sigma-70 family)
MPPLDSDAHTWYRTQIQPHEAMLRAWLKGRFPHHRDIEDILQEAILRVLTAREGGEIRSPKAFLFATARNLVVGEIRKSAHRQNFQLADWDELDVSDENTDIPQSVARSEELEILTCAIQSLPNRCRQIITLRKIYGMSQNEIAAELGISVNTVETQGTIGMRKLSAYFERLRNTRPHYNQ